MGLISLIKNELITDWRKPEVRVDYIVVFILLIIMFISYIIMSIMNCR